MARRPAEPQVWQVSGGPANRSYVDVLLRHGVALIGPGDAGPWHPGRDDQEMGGGFVRRFARDVQPGDILLLRSGSSAIHAVGLVAGDYCYLSQFDDVNGWDLQHARRVRWYPLPEPYHFDEWVFGANPPRLSRLAAAELVDYARRFVSAPPLHWQTAPLPHLPEEEPFLEALPAGLEGLATLVAQVQDLVGLYEQRDGFGDRPSEDELLAHCVVPLFRALGWPVERIALKWRYVDASLFRVLPRTPDNLHLIVEAKRLGAGVEGALAQARGYLQALGVSRDVMVTDGIRYRLYAAELDFAPVAYANLARLKQPALALFGRLKRP